MIEEAGKTEGDQRIALPRCEGCNSHQVAILTTPLSSLLRLACKHRCTKQHTHSIRILGKSFEVFPVHSLAEGQQCANPRWVTFVQYRLLRSP